LDRSTARVCDPHPRYLNHVRASKDALSLSVRTASPHKSDNLLDRESMRPHDCLSTAFRTGGQQHERPPVVDREAAPLAWFVRRHGLALAADIPAAIYFAGRQGMFSAARKEYVEKIFVVSRPRNPAALAPDAGGI
jgi:hypothetical protein